MQQNMPTISENVLKFKETKNIYYLFKAIFLVLKRGRTHELLYGYYCKLLHKPSTVTSQEVSVMLEDFEKNIHELKREFISPKALQELYGDKYAINTIPDDFVGTRSESIIEKDSYLIMGEYGMDNNSAKIIYVDAEKTISNDHYMHVSGVRHIHALHTYNESGEILVATGDRLKVLDLWSLDRNSGELTFKNRIQRFLAGYTAIAKVNGNFYFGTDFSARPNYIEMEGGKKFFFPEPAYTKFVMNFKVFSNRYILALNSDLGELGGGKALSIFDTETNTFIYCTSVELPD